MAKKKKKPGISPARQLVILIVVAGLGFIWLLIYQEQIVRDTWQTLVAADIRYVLMLPVLQIINYYIIGNYYRKMFEVFGAKIGRTRSWGVVAAMNFVNQVLPSGGLSGITYLAYGFRSKIQTGKTALVQVGRYMFAFASYGILAPLAFFLILTSGRSSDLDRLMNEATGSWAVFVVVGIFMSLLGFTVASFFNERVAHVTGRAVLKTLNWVNFTILRRKSPIKLHFAKQLNRELHQGTALIKKKGWRAVRPGMYMLLSVCMEVIIVFVSLLAVGGGDVGIGPVFLAFVAANVVGTVSIIPGDVGVHEATVIIVLVAFGVDEPVAISTTLLYRVFNKFIFLPIGFFFYARILKPALEHKD